MWVKGHARQANSAPMVRVLLAVSPMGIRREHVLVVSSVAQTVSVLRDALMSAAQMAKALARQDNCAVQEPASLDAMAAVRVPVLPANSVVTAVAFLAAREAQTRGVAHLGPCAVPERVQVPARLVGRLVSAGSGRRTR